MRSGVSMAWSGPNQLLEETFIRDFDSSSLEANLRAIRSIRNFITANPVNKRIVVENDLIRGRMMSLTAAFSPTTEYSTIFKRDFLCMYASFLRESPAFAEELCKQRDFLNDLLDAVNISCESSDLPLREAIMLFLKTLFEADDLDQDFESLPDFKRTTALFVLGLCASLHTQEVFTVDRLADLVHLNEALFEALRRGVERARGGASVSTLVCLTKLLALLSSCATLAERGGVTLLRMAHRGVMATACPRHAPLQHQDRGLILPFDLANSAPCPDAAAHAVSHSTHHSSHLPDFSNAEMKPNILNGVDLIFEDCRSVARFSLKILFFAIYHVPLAFETFKGVVCETDPRALISIYSHLSQPYSRCHLGLRGGPKVSSLCRHRETHSDHLIYRLSGRSLEENNTIDEYGYNDNEEEMKTEAEIVDSLGLCSPDGAFGLSGTADRTMCLLVGLLRGVLFWRCCCSFVAIDNSSSKTNTVVVACDRFGRETLRADGLGLSDDQISLKILQPLTQNSLPLNGTGVNTWACHVVVLVLKQRRSLHHHLLYSQLLTPEFDDTVSCLLKALQPTCDYDDYADFLEQLIPFSRLFACLVSTCEDVRVRIGNLSMTRALIQMFVTHPSLTTSTSVASLNLTLAVCQLLHGLSRSAVLLHTLFSDVSIINCLIEVCTRLLPTVSSDPNHAEIVLAASSTLVNLQLCQLPDPDFQTSRVKCIDVFHSLLNVGGAEVEIALSLRLNGVWGLASAAASAASNRLANRVEAIERLDTARTVPEIISQCGALLSSSSPVGECDASAVDRSEQRKVVFETSGSVLNSKPSRTHLELYFIQKGLLLLRNLFALKEVQVTNYSESVFSLLAKVLSSNQAGSAKYEVIKTSCPVTTTTGYVPLIERFPFKAMVVLANLLTNADARSQFWYQSELIEALATTITPDAETSLLCGAILVVVNILEAPEPLATSVGGDSPGELFTQILTLLLFDDSRSYRIGYKTTSSSWCRRSSFRSSQHRSVATATTSPSPSRQSPEAMETTAETSVAASEPSPPPTVEAESQDKPLLRLLGSFVDLFFVYSETGTSSASSTSIVTGSSSSSKQVFREVWDWQYQCGRGGDSEDERPRRRRGKRFATAATSTTTSPHYRNSCPLLHRQEAKFTLAKGFTDAAGAAGGLKSLLVSLAGDIEDEPASTSPPRRVEASAGGVISEEGEFEDN
ncbi:unnamed protein product [Taenia asiatica]|uniref:FPL domain-containing protein n=1 Tax=Taenia asiatica TaxID=60517 RepID=A0A158R704_TAEAS|nr:unnamed protein product [Taenia asiatica]